MRIRREKSGANRSQEIERRGKGNREDERAEEIQTKRERRKEENCGYTRRKKMKL